MDDAVLDMEGPGPNIERQAKLFALLYSPEEVEVRGRRIHEAMRAQSPNIRESDFTVIGTDDLERLFVWYDGEFFRGRLAEMLVEDCAHPIVFRLSRRLVRGRPDDPAGSASSQWRQASGEGRVRDHSFSNAPL